MAGKKEILQRIRDRIKEIEPGASVILFGSNARCDNTEHSDFDILILLNKSNVSAADEKRIKYPLYELEIELGRIISPLVLSKSDWQNRHRITPFYENVNREGILL